MWQRGRPLPPARSGGMGGPGMRGGAVGNLPALHKTESAFKVRLMSCLSQAWAVHASSVSWVVAFVLVMHPCVRISATSEVCGAWVSGGSLEQCACVVLASGAALALQGWDPMQQEHTRLEPLYSHWCYHTHNSLQAGMTVTDDPEEEANQRSFKGVLKTPTFLSPILPKGPALLHSRPRQLLTACCLPVALIALAAGGHDCDG
jgi:hypothetical protein